MAGEGLEGGSALAEEDDAADEAEALAEATPRPEAEAFADVAAGARPAGLGCGPE